MKRNRKAMIAWIIAVIAVVLVLAVLTLAVLLIPIRSVAEDGGTVVYSAVLYQVECLHRLTFVDGTFGHIEGYRVEILGFTVYEKTEFVPT